MQSNVGYIGTRIAKNDEFQLQIATPSASDHDECRTFRWGKT